MNITRRNFVLVSAAGAAAALVVSPALIQLVRYSLIANGVPDAAALVVKAGLIVLAVWLQRHGKNGS